MPPAVWRQLLQHPGAQPAWCPTYLHVPLQLLQQCHVFIQPQEGFAEARG